MMWKIAECYESDGEIQKSVDETEKALKLISTVDDTYFNSYTDFFNKQISRLK